MIEWVALHALLGFTPVLASHQQEPIVLSQETSCPQPQLSCSSTTTSSSSSAVDTCCVNSPGGLFLQTQFWDSSPSLGPADAWTIHGLWPDLCDGGYDQSCDSSRSLTDIRSTLLAASSSASDLVDFMSEYWLSINGDNNDLWAHEWNKHGTCVSTLEPTCYGDASDTSHKDVLDYFSRVVELYRTRNTYEALAAANILPSNDQTYALSDLQSAVSAIQGADVTFRCESNKLTEVWYHFRVRGPLRDAPPFSSSSSSSGMISSDNSVIAAAAAAAAGVAAAADNSSIFVPTSPTDGTSSNCPSSGIQYLPKSSSSSSTSNDDVVRLASPKSTSTSTPFSGTGHLLVRPISPSTATAESGCLNGSGQWHLPSDTSSCAEYAAKDGTQLSSPSSSSSVAKNVNDDNDESFSLSSLNAPCSVIPPAFESGGGLFLCQQDLGIRSLYTSVAADDSQSDTSSTGLYKLRYLDQTTFYADKVPATADEKVNIYVNSENGARTVELEILWQAV